MHYIKKVNNNVDFMFYVTNINGRVIKILETYYSFTRIKYNKILFINIKLVDSVNYRDYIHELFKYTSNSLSLRPVAVKVITAGKPISVISLMPFTTFLQLLDEKVVYFHLIMSILNSQLRLYLYSCELMKDILFNFTSLVTTRYEI